MEEIDYQSLQQLLDEYYSKLLSSKEKDPKKNALYQQMLQQLSVLAKGTEMISPYEQYLQNDFVTFWKRHCFDSLLEEYKARFTERLAASTNRDKLFDLEIKDLDKYDVCDVVLTGDHRHDGEKLGHLLAIKGDNPNIESLITNLGSYDFGILPVIARTKAEFFAPDHWGRLQKRYGEIFRKLHWVCVGYLAEQKLGFVRQLKLGSCEHAPVSEENDPATVRLTLKQQVLLLHRLGFLDLEQIQRLTTKNQGKLLGRLFGRSEKNSEDIIRNRLGTKVEKKFSLAGKEVTDAVDALMDEIKWKL